ncbi:SAM-dependent methyltransferase [Actinomadura hibisca]|uniref:SAM-dependent methyltransferase n=1 Tax=Actinomadura hibisca TaxID=68565 RepID=UPI00082FD8A1|nr:class I SAM-dependent methyltransferase [Actinomadura hibisca]
MTEHNGADAAFWDARYSESDRIWSGRPNTMLVREITGVRPGAALDIGSGEGADAIWLAEQGWQVTAVDISQVALDRAAEEAAKAGVADRVDWQRHDLGETFPKGEFDLVSAQYLHAPGEMPREKMLRRAADAVAPGGLLMVVGHAIAPSWNQRPEGHGHHDMTFPTTADVLESLALPEGGWETVRDEEFEWTKPGPDGEPLTRTDNLLLLRRAA